MTYVLQVDQLVEGKTCVVVAHGDVLQILQTHFVRVPPAMHRSLPHLDKAEVRWLYRLSAK